MNFAQMLAMDVKPLPDTREPKKDKSEPKKTTWKRNTQPAIEFRAWTSKAKYKSVMGDWIRTRDLETKMGMAKAGSFATLVRYESAGLVERRPYQNLPYNQRRGWEWRWIG